MARGGPPAGGPEVTRAFAAFDRMGRRLDAVYSVAGISGRRFGDGPLHEATLEGWETVLATNATSQFLVARAALAADARPGAGRERLARDDPADVERARAVPGRRALRDPRLRGEQGGDRRARAGDRVHVRRGRDPDQRDRPVADRDADEPRAQDDPRSVAYLRAKQPLAAVRSTPRRSPRSRSTCSRTTRGWSPDRSSRWTAAGASASPRPGALIRPSDPE